LTKERKYGIIDSSKGKGGRNMVAKVLYMIMDAIMKIGYIQWR
jgi:hypothetical protein